jgi:hypothetical protein
LSSQNSDLAERKSPKQNNIHYRSIIRKDPSSTMKISTFSFGLLFCLTPAPAISRRLTESMSTKQKNEKDEYYDELYGDGVEPAEEGGVEGDIEPNTDSEPVDYVEEPVDYVEDSYTDAQNGSVDYGYVEAALLWNRTHYSCESITNIFWVDVQTSVFPLCDSTWKADSMWASYSQLCKTGAEQFTVEAMDNCFDTTKCAAVGVSAAASVAGTFCKQNGLYHERDGSWIPTKCVQHAAISCKKDAVETVEKFNQGGVCASGSALEYVNEIHQLCDQEVATMEQAANLAGF